MKPRFLSLLTAFILAAGLSACSNDTPQTSSENDINSFAKGYEALLYILLHVDKIENKESTLRFLIRGLVLQMVE